MCLDLAKQVVEISEGRARILQRESCSETNDLRSPCKDVSCESTITDLSKAPPIRKFIEDEHRAAGGIRFSMYWQYILAGKKKYWSLLVCIMGVWRLVGVGQTWFLKQWSESYTTTRTTSSPFRNLPPPNSNIRPWLWGFFLLAAAQAMMNLISQSFMLIIIYTSGRRMFSDVLRRVSSTTFRFYDITPVGRLMNRMTSDLGTIDGSISQQIQDVAWLSILWSRSLPTS